MKFGFNHVLIGMRSEMAENAGSLGEPMICDLSGIVNEGFTIPRNSVLKNIFL